MIRLVRLKDAFVATPSEPKSSLSIVERALELAATGRYISVNHIRQQLRRDGYTDISSGLFGAATNSAIVRALQVAQTKCASETRN